MKWIGSSPTIFCHERRGSPGFVRSLLASRRVVPFGPVRPISSPSSRICHGSGDFSELSLGYRANEARPANASATSAAIPATGVVAAVISIVDHSAGFPVVNVGGVTAILVGCSPGASAQT